jgi:two-component system, NtrC family, sensor histidine kinase HydH
MPSKNWMRRAALIFMVGVIAVAQNVTPVDQTHWHYVFPRLYYLPIVFAALSEGWRGGLLVALFSSLAFFQQFLVTEHLFTERLINRYIELASFCSLAVLTGVYTDKERHRRREYQDVTQKLSAAYETLQTNFEGMKRAERLSAIGHLSAGLAHEIRNPLASIAGAASILRRSAPSDDEKVTRCINIIEGECKRLNDLLTDFLNFARPRSPHFQTVDLEVLFANVIELAEHALNRRRISFHREISPEVKNVECDPEQLRQVLLNLLINAIEASGEGATVGLLAGVEDDRVVIRVVDEGSGVAPEDVDKLFDPFFTTKETGTGLGLPVAHQIVGQMGGNLSARRNDGTGMTFSVELPIKKLTTA